MRVVVSSFFFVSLLLLLLLVHSHALLLLGIGNKNKSSSSSSSSSPPSFVVTTTTTTTARTIGLPAAAQETTTTTTTWNERLLTLSNTASILCVVDCTVLPILTIGLPLVGLVLPITITHHAALHVWGHRIALGFVVPVGVVANVAQYMWVHGKKRIASVGGMGVLAVLTANWPHSWYHHYHAASSSSFAWVSLLLHMVHEGPAHRMTNLLGCALLLTANYWSRQHGCAAGCNHVYHNNNNNKKKNAPSLNRFLKLK